MLLFQVKGQAAMMPVRWGAAILHNVIIGQLWLVRGLVGLHYNATLCKIAWSRVGLWRVFWSAEGAALWLLPRALGLVRRRQSHRRTCGGGKRQWAARRVGKKRDANVCRQWVDVGGITTLFHLFYRLPVLDNR